MQEASGARGPSKRARCTRLVLHEDPAALDKAARQELLSRNHVAMPSSVLRRSAERHDWLSQQLRASPGTPHPGSASLQQGMRHCESWACRCQESSRGSAPLTVQAGRLGSCRTWCGLTLSWPSRASDSPRGLSSYLHMKSAASKHPNVTANAPCSWALPLQCSTLCTMGSAVSSPVQ